VFELFPGNYRWSYNVMMAMTAGAQLGDIGLIAERLRQPRADDTAWHHEWSWLAEVLERRAAEALARGSSETASDDLFLASLYHTMAERFISPRDPRRQESYARALSTFEQARTLSSYLTERVLVPYDETTLPAYFMPSLAGSGRRPAVIFLCGLDTTKEMSFLRIRQHLARRGLHCLAIDTPGVGEALRLQHLPTRHDYEHPVAAAVDYLEGREDVDPAAFEPRIAACVAWGAILDYHAVWARRLQAGGPMSVPTFQIMFITGAETAEQGLERIEHFKFAEFGQRIQCPFLLLHGADDQQISLDDARTVFEMIGSPRKEMKVFTGEDGGTQHSQQDNALPAIHYMCDWMARTLEDS
jgi:hypothetical protein